MSEHDTPEPDELEAVREAKWRERGLESVKAAKAALKAARKEATRKEQSA